MIGVVVTDRVDEVGIDRAPAPIAEDPRRFPPQRADRHLLELGVREVVERTARFSIVTNDGMRSKVLTAYGIAVCAVA
jgi:hypothetical protein